MIDAWSTMHPAWIWAIAGLVLIFAEVILPGVFLLWLGAAALVVAATLGFVVLHWESQVVVFIAASIATCILGWVAFMRHRRGSGFPRDINEPATMMLGEVGTVVEPIRNGRGKVRLRDSVWLASGPDLDAGTRVRVVGQRGTVIEVAK